MRGNAKNILFVSHSTSLHGAEMVGLEIIKILKKNGCNVFVLFPLAASYDRFEEQIRAELGDDQILKLPYKNAGNGIIRDIFVSIYNYKTLKSLVKFCKQNKINAIFSNTYTSIIGIELSKRLLIPHFWHFHEQANKNFGWYNSMQIEYKRRLNYTKNSVIFISKGQKQQWEDKLGNINGCVVYNPIRNIKEKKILTQYPLNFGFIGSFDNRKNLSLLLNAYSQLRAHNHNIKLVIAGAKNEDEIQNTYNSFRNLEIEILPYTDANEFFNKIDVLVLPSESETMPLVVFEAIQAKVAVIQTNHSFIKELLSNKETLFIEPDIDELIDAMIRVEDCQFRENVVHNAFLKLQEYNFNTNFEAKIIDLLCV